MIRILAVLTLAICLPWGCSPAKQNKEVLAKIDDYSLYSEDFINEISSMSGFEREDKTSEELLDYVIQKKLLLLQAQKEGLDRQAPFMKMVEHFWEQSLLRSILEKKMKEFFETAHVSDEELEKAAAETGRSAEEIREVLVREKVNIKFEEWLADLKGRTRVYVNKKALEKITVPKE